ncbi:hypothetical protein [Oscillibacter sp.]|uniref:hypothetical protein n=1 Tax=Oscillibacter sp. TaxID=1945593 RepID=UPI002D7E70AD|nr:hypothetical protein [Oscillibacter sp.]
MTYELLMRIAEKENRLNLEIVEIIIDQLLHTKNDDDFSLDEYEDSNYYKLGQLAKLIGDKNIFIESGKADNFHNVAVAYAKSHYFDWACTILQRGLEEKSTAGAVDLLADYLAYGISCGQQDRCSKYYQRLCKNPREKWNWRAYSFSIDYLLDQHNEDMEEVRYSKIREEALRIANEAIERRGDDQAYLDKAEIYKDGLPEEERRILEDAVQKLGYAAPKCALRLADIMFEAAEYEEASEKLLICCNAYQMQRTINKEYVRLLLALCKTSILFKKHPDGDYAPYADDIHSIYRDINTALKEDNHRRFNETAKLLSKVVEAMTGIKYTYGIYSDNYEDFEDYDEEND